MGGARLRGAHTERRCAGVVDGAGLAGGEMSEDPLDDAQRAATHTTVFDDAWSVARQLDGATILAESNQYVSRSARIDYCFSGAELSEQLVTACVDREAAGSDHQPLWVEIRIQEP